MTAPQIDERSADHSAPSPPARGARASGPRAPVVVRVRESLGTLVAQLFFIAAGVYLGNQADSWKEEREHRAAARATIENFRTEIRRNREQVALMRDYHGAMRDTMAAVLRDRSPAPVDAMTRRLRWRGRDEFDGFGGVEFSTTAWELALATQALAWVEPPLAFRIAAVYTQQRTFADIQSAFMRALWAPETHAMTDQRPFASALRAYLGDATYQERTLVQRYDALLPGLDSALARMPK